VDFTSRLSLVELLSIAGVGTDSGSNIGSASVFFSGCSSGSVTALSESVGAGPILPHDQPTPAESLLSYRRKRHPARTYGLGRCLYNRSCEHDAANRQYGSPSGISESHSGHLAITADPTWKKLSIYLKSQERFSDNYFVTFVQHLRRSRKQPSPAFTKVPFVEPRSSMKYESSRRMMRACFRETLESGSYASRSMSGKTPLSASQRPMFDSSAVSGNSVLAAVTALYQSVACTWTSPSSSGSSSDPFASGCRSTIGGIPTEVTLAALKFGLLIRSSTAHAEIPLTGVILLSAPSLQSASRTRRKISMYQ
jgi:hypothetical protein